ncbi:MAG: M48 family metallopeptidase [Candidatus Obscuribacterales bacterium]|nr:M48 family metallopeptidase [Candidatus Obscuribacterales bacterium]
MDSFQARFYDSSGSSPDLVQVQVASGKIIVAGTAFGIAFEDLKLQVGGHDGDRFKLICEQKNVAIVSEDRRLLTAIANAAGGTELGKQAAQAEHRIVKRGTYNARYWSIVVGSICALAIAGYLLLDPLSAAVATKIDPSFEIKLGEMLARTEKLDKTSESYKRVARIGNQLVSKLEKSPYKFQFFVKKDREINACAYPGGILIVNSALIDKADDDEELAGVIAHEIGHVIHRHTLKQALHNCGLITCLSIISGGVGTGADTEKLEAALALAQKLESLNFSRSQETDADITGLELEVKSGFRGDGLIQFFRRLEKQESTLGKGGAVVFALLSTHPMSAERAARIEEELKRLKKLHAD